MADMEKVIKGLQEAAAYFRSSFDAMYGTVAFEKFRSWTDAIEQALALLKAQEKATIEPKRIDLDDETKAWLDKMDAVDALGNIADICMDWDGYRTADGLGGLVNEIWAYARYCALTLLKAQEARVMTLEELDELQEDDAVFVEIKPVRDLTCMSVELVRFIEKTQDPATQIELHTTDSAGFYMTRKTTDPNWRCWTSRPTDEQREATPWRS